MATSLVACPGSSIARELIPFGGGIGGDTAAILLGLKLYNSFPFLHRYITLIAGSHHLISQAGWNRYIYLSISLVLFYTMTITLLWDLPEDVLAAPASALCGWTGVNSSLLSLLSQLAREISTAILSTR